MQMFQTRLRLGAALLVAAACLPVAAQTAVLAPSVPLTPAAPEPASTAAPTAAAATPALHIARFHADPLGGLVAGDTVRFTLEGTPGAIASVSMPGPDVAVPLRELQPGHYEGSHVLRAQDLSVPSPVVARLQLGSRQASVQLATQFAASSPASGTAVLGAAPATAPLTLQVIAPVDNTVLDGHPAVIRGRTAPNALVRARLDAVTPAGAGRTSVARSMPEQTVQADAEGNFVFSFAPQPMPAGTRYEVELRASQGGQTSSGLRLVLFPRRG